ncbi:MAG: 16S rRNA (cytosine(1402)-N(4))-methyltransferase RsmH [Acidobacteriota bacterium]
MQGTEAENLHTPVLLEETIRLIEPENGGLFVDATLGLGGHSEAILMASDETELIAIDQDAAAIAKAGTRLAPFGSRARLVHANFAKMKPVVRGLTKEQPQGILADLGVSSLQFDSDSRGFSFRFDAPLDMRMDQQGDGETAADILATRSEEEIANIIYHFGEERHSRRIARRIVEAREHGETVKTTGELVRLVERSVRRSPRDKIHPATRTFQALRIAVNNELEIIEGFILDSIEILKTEGILEVITFHSLEDRIVKQVFQRLAGKCSCPPRIPQCICGAAKRVEILTRRPVIPGDAEISANPRARSAKLRACKKLEFETLSGDLP